MPESYVNGGTTTLTAALAASDTALDINPIDATRLPTSGEFRLAVSDGQHVELVLVTGGQGTAHLVIQRAIEPYNGDQIAFDFAAGATVAHVLTLDSLLLLVQMNVQVNAVDNELRAYVQRIMSELDPGGPPPPVVTYRDLYGSAAGGSF